MPIKLTDGQPNTPLRFDGFRTPRYTPVPDQLFDELLAELSGAELKVLLYICRRTFGFKKDSDNISLNQLLNGIRRRDGTILDRGVGLSKPTLLRALKSLKAKRVIFAERRQNVEEGNLATNYRLHVCEDLGQKMNQPEARNLTKTLGPEINHQQETEDQETATTLRDQMLGLGIDALTVGRLLKTHDHQLVGQKIDYVAFMQENQAASVKNPRGWLLKAIEHDYGPPAGYRSRAVREARKRQHEKRRSSSAIADTQRQEAMRDALRRRQEEADRLLAEAQEAYQTSPAEAGLWQEVLTQLQQEVSGTTFALIRQARLLTTDDGVAVVATANHLSAHWLRSNQGARLPALFARCGHPVEGVRIIQLTSQ